MTRSTYWKTACAMLLLLATTTSPGQVFTTLVNFDITNGANPESSLVQGVDGNLYGTTTMGGTNNWGTVFTITEGGALTTLYSFCNGLFCTDSMRPTAGLVLALDGFFYGTTEYGGSSSVGTVFRISPGAAFTNLNSFTFGRYPMAALVQNRNGNFFGTTFGSEGEGSTVFRMTADGALVPLYTFCENLTCVDGISPWAGVIEGIDGDFYGTTTLGGNLTCGGGAGCGTVFKATAEGTLTTLHSFSAHDGSNPYGTLVQATDGNFYGTTRFGGANNGGTIFRITSAGALTTLYSFCAQGGCADGSNPWAGLIQATDGNLYGTTNTGGNLACGGGLGCGTLFKITRNGTLTVLHNFDTAHGDSSYGCLLQATDGKIYGTTAFGGTDNQGTVFRLSTGLAPFVTFVRAAGKVGETGPVLGQGFTGTTSVAINGIQANFTVISDTDIRATVPPGATTGYVTVTTPSGTLSSNVPFHVIP